MRMSHDMTPPAVGSLWRNINTRMVFTVMGHCILHYNATGAVLYQRSGNDKPWAMELREFMGRFEPFKT